MFTGKSSSGRLHSLPHGIAARRRVQASAEKAGLTPLLASFGSSLLERALIDAAGPREGCQLS